MDDFSGISEASAVRVKPNNIEAEQSVLGSMIMSRDVLVEMSAILTKEDFYRNENGIIFETMVKMADEGLTVDLITLSEKLKEANAPAAVQSTAFLKSLIMAVQTVSNAKDHAKIIKDNALLRRIIEVNNEIADSCYALNENVDSILETTEKKIFNLTQSKASKDIRGIDDITSETLKQISDAARMRDTVTGVPTGFTDLDDYLSGLQPSDFILVAARPSMGKTAFVLNIADNVAVKQGITTAIFSLEMSSSQLVKRMLSLESTVDAEKLRTGRLHTDEWERLVEGADDIAKSNLVIDDTPSITVGELASKCRKIKMEKGLGLIIIDYLQLMGSSGHYESKQSEVSDISRSLKALARELDVPVVTLSQLSRAPEKRDDHRPMMSDLRESGAIEQDADVVMFIYRDDYYNRDSESKGVSEIIIGKQRNGPVGTVKLAWLAEQTRFANLVRERN